MLDQVGSGVKASCSVVCQHLDAFYAELRLLKAQGIGAAGHDVPAGPTKDMPAPAGKASSVSSSAVRFQSGMLRSRLHAGTGHGGSKLAPCS